ncbi:hypothetical protein B0H14DRAFT_2980351 [Mycena olivaceomarginata]|nr:hypothetical protein B0H14DRAFT_2980351 [Mycena olivaceomarginata]
MGTSLEIRPGDIVAVSHGTYGRREGLVVGAYIDYAGRQILEVQMDAGDIYNAWYPTVTRVRPHPLLRAPPSSRQRTIERHIYW